MQIWKPYFILILLLIFIYSLLLLKYYIFDVAVHQESESCLNPRVWINKYRSGRIDILLSYLLLQPRWFSFFVLCFTLAKICILIDAVSDKSRCYYRQKSWGLACRIWRSSWLTLIAEVDLGSSTTCWSITWPGFMSMSTRGRILCPMLWRIFWPSKVTAARSRDNSTWPVRLFNVSFVVMQLETLGSRLLCEMRRRLARHCSYCVTFWQRDDNMPYQYIQDQQAWFRQFWHETAPGVFLANGLLVWSGLVCVSSVWRRHRYGTTKPLNQEAGNKQYKPLPITLTQCWYILIIFGGSGRVYRLSCRGQMETNHNNIEQGAVWPT